MPMSDRTNYARYLPLYWAKMKNPPNTHPEAHQKFLRGEFSGQRSSVRGFSQTAVDQTVEQTVNESAKTKDGIIDFSLKRVQYSDGSLLPTREHLLL